MSGGSISLADDDPLGPVVESFLDRFRRGERPALTELIARQPDLAGRIRELIPALVELERLGGSRGDFVASSENRTGDKKIDLWDALTGTAFVSVAHPNNGRPSRRGRSRTRRPGRRAARERLRPRTLSDSGERWA